MDITTFNRRLDSFSCLCCDCEITRFIERSSRLFKTLVQCKGFTLSPNGEYSVDYVMTVLLANMVANDLIAFDNRINKAYVRTEGIFKHLLPMGFRNETLVYFRAYIELEMGVFPARSRSLINCPGGAYEYLMSFKPDFIEPRLWCHQYCKDGKYLNNPRQRSFEMWH